MIYDIRKHPRNAATEPFIDIGTFTSARFGHIDIIEMGQFVEVVCVRNLVLLYVSVHADLCMGDDCSSMDQIAMKQYAGFRCGQVSRRDYYWVGI